MSVQYLLVTFEEDRAVLANGDKVGIANHMLMLPANQYEVSLEGSGYAPATQTVILAGTSIVRPKVIAFAVTAAPPVA